MKNFLRILTLIKYLLSTREFEPNVKRLPEGYPVYCIYIPSGFDYEFEKNLIEELAKWGKRWGKNLYVATWDIGDPSYEKLSKDINLDKIPALILTDDNEPNINSFLIKITDIKVINNINFLKEILLNLFQLILTGKNLEALKQYLREKNEMKIKNLAKDVIKNLKIKLKFSISLGPFSVSIEN
jgi:hypothetical protein